MSLSSLFSHFSDLSKYRQRLKKRLQLRRLVVESLEPRHLLATLTVTDLTDIVNSTFSGNSAQRHGGAILSGSINPTEFIHTTIVANTARSTDGASADGGGISGTGFVTLQNTIVAGNKRGTASPLDSDIVSSVGSGVSIVTGTSSGNLIGNAATASGLVHGNNGNILGNNGSGVLPLTSILDPTLRNNGGRTLTHALLATSVAIDKGFFNYVGTGSTIDQRGELRPRDFLSITNSGDGRDIGANGFDAIVGMGGADILLGGRGNDILAVSDLTFKRIVGGNGNATDTSAVRQNQSPGINSVAVTSLYDLNRDGRVNATDTSIVRQNVNSAIITLFTAPLSLPLADSLFADESFSFEDASLGDYFKRLGQRRG